MYNSLENIKTHEYTYSKIAVYFIRCLWALREILLKVIGMYF